jgi:hypothetical protein
MKFAIKTLFLAVVLLIYPLSSSAQLADITQIPGQVDRSEALASASIIESANGDLLAFILENGELTNVSGFPWEGEPAMLWTSRSTDGGDSWSTPQIIRVGIDT